MFKGFLPRKTKEQKQRLLGLMSEQRTIVIYEAPHRIIKTLEALKDVFKNRRVAIAREITKIHEEFIYGTLEDVIKGFKTKKPRGEMVIVVEGSTSQATPSLWEKGVKPTLSDIELVDLLQSIIRENTREGLSKNTALRSAAEKLGLSRNEAYELLIKETKKERPE